MLRTDVLHPHANHDYTRSGNEQMCKVQTVKLKKPGFASARENREDNFTVPILISDQLPTCNFAKKRAT
jgi:hypothetical protein